MSLYPHPTISLDLGYSGMRRHKWSRQSSSPASDFDTSATSQVDAQEQIMIQGADVWSVHVTVQQPVA